jgi:hypothetical protein
LNLNIEHQGHRPLGPNPVIPAQIKCRLVKLSCSLYLDLLKFFATPQRLEEAAPRLIDHKPSRILDRPSPGKLLFPIRLQHRLEYRIVLVEDLLEALGVLPIHLLQERLETALP